MHLMKKKQSTSKYVYKLWNSELKDWIHLQYASGKNMTLIELYKTQCTTKFDQFKIVMSIDFIILLTIRLTRLSISQCLRYVLKRCALS